MKDQENNISSKPPHETSRNPKEDIPLWLQGLEEETKANRIQAAKGELPKAEEGSQASTSSDTSQDSGDEIETFSEELAVLEDAQKSDDELQKDFLTSDTAEDTVEPLETLPDTLNTEEEEGQSQEEETGKVDDTEKISIMTSDFLNDENENLEWVNEITELDIEPSTVSEDHTQPKNILEVDQQHLENELENSVPEPASRSEEEPFMDISELIADDSLEDFASNQEEEEPASGLLEIIQKSEDSPFIEDKILSDNEESSYLEGGTSPIDENLAFDEEEVLPDDEELPKWLQRLITESYPEENFYQPTPLAEEALNEITKPVVLTSPQSLADDLEAIEGLESFEDFEELEDFEEVQKPDISSPIENLDDTGSAPEQEAVQGEAALPNEETAIDIDPVNVEAAEELSPADETPLSEEDFGAFSDEDTQPVMIIEEIPEEMPLVIEEPIEWTEEDNLYFNPVNGYLIEIPEPLQFAKQVLKQGDINQGLDIIKTYISDDSYLDEIREWLLEAAESRMESQSELWEAIGDIAANQDKHQEALAAYSKAINYLLSTKE